MNQDVFQNIIGHDRVKDLLARAGENGRLAHAYLFIGPRGVGKRTLAQSFIESFIGGKLETHPDVTIIRRQTDEKTGKKRSFISVEQIRSLKEKLSMSSLYGKKKAVFIEDADKLNAAGANSLLKTLEEPKGNTLLILRAQHLESVPRTIASRCQTLRFSLVPTGTIASALVERGSSKKDAEEIAALSLGRPGLALRFLKDSGLRAERETALSFLLDQIGQTPARRLGAIADLLPKDEANKLEVAEEKLDAWELVLRDILLRANASEGIVHRTERDRIEKAATSKPSDHWQSGLERLKEARESIQHNGNLQLAFEHILLRL